MPSAKKPVKRMSAKQMKKTKGGLAIPTGSMAGGVNPGTTMPKPRKTALE